MTTTAKTPQSLRAEADRLENEAGNIHKGKVYIYDKIGSAFVHLGDRTSDMVLQFTREATEAEVAALCIIPEFKAYLEKVREG